MTSFPHQGPLDIQHHLSSLTRPVADHSAWARSVRWSCGRPGWKPTFEVEWGEAYRATIRAERARAFVALGINHPAGFLTVSSVV